MAGRSWCMMRTANLAEGNDVAYRGKLTRRNCGRSGGDASVLCRSRDGRRLRRAPCKPNWPSIHFDQGQLPPQFRWTTIDCPNIELAGTIVVD